MKKIPRTNHTPTATSWGLTWPLTWGPSYAVGAPSSSGLLIQAQIPGGPFVNFIDSASPVNYTAQVPGGPYVNGY